MTWASDQNLTCIPLVSNFDVFPTLLELAGLAAPAGLESKAVSLLAPEAERLRLVEYPADFKYPFPIRKVHPEWDSSRFDHRLTALFEGNTKLIWASDETYELYDLASDPDEERNLYATEGDDARRLIDRLDEFVDTLTVFEPDDMRESELSAEQRKRLEALGYVDGTDG